MKIKPRKDSPVPSATEETPVRSPENSMLRSKMARRLMRLFVLMIAVPFILFSSLLNYVGRGQLVSTVHIVQTINRTGMQGASRRFQTLGHEALMRSSEQAGTTSARGVYAMSQKLAEIQAKSLTQTTHALGDLTSQGIRATLHQSAQSHHATLQQIETHMTGLVLHSAQATQRQAAGNIERAMLALNDTLMRQRAHDLAAQLSLNLQNAPVFLQFTAQMPDMRDGKVQGQKATLDALVRRLPAFLTVAVLDKTGRETAKAASDSLITQSDLQQAADEPYFKQALAGQTYTALTAERHNGVPVMRMAVPIEAYRGKIVGVVAARYSLEALWDTIRGTRIGRRGFAWVQDAGGKALLTPLGTNEAMLTTAADVDSLHWRVVVSVPRREAMQPIAALKADIAENARRASAQMQREIGSVAHRADARLQQAMQKLHDQALEQIRTRFASELKGVQQTTASHTDAELGRMQQTMQDQTARTQQRSDAAMSQASRAALSQMESSTQTQTQKALGIVDSRMSLLAAGFMLTFCGLGCGLALVTAGRIVRPVLRLVSVTQSIADGDLDRRVDENAPDEIGDLAVAFNTMAARLQQSRDSLHEAEAQLVQSAKLASLGTLSAGVAHELNQPVAIIRGLAQQLQGEPDLHPDVLEDLKLIEGQTGRMTKIIKHLRTFCRVGGEEKARFDVHEVIHNCFLFVGAQLKAHNVVAELQLGGVTPWVEGDANELEQVFLNLVTNARDALEGRDDAQVTIRTRVDDQQVVIEFEDNGTGIPDHVITHIFDPFFTTKEPGKGTGLGLSISHSILKKHGGTIRATNNPGALFTLTLPLAQAAEDEDGATQGSDVARPLPRAA